MDVNIRILEIICKMYKATSTGDTFFLEDAQSFMINMCLTKEES